MKDTVEYEGDLKKVPVFKTGSFFIFEFFAKISIF